MLKKRHECKIFLKKEKKKLEDRAQDHLILVSFSVTAVLFVLRWFCNGVSLSFDADRKWKIVAFKERRSFISTIIRLSADNESPEKVRFLVILSLSSLLLPLDTFLELCRTCFRDETPAVFSYPRALMRRHTCNDCLSTDFTIAVVVFNSQLDLNLSWSRMQPEGMVIGTESERVKAFGKVRGTIGEERDWHRDRNRAH